eukprot:CAMPEP_0118654964 /NCGR_PEP_ID=MMETSP0785-20121206/12669_1 /TAXON_ID=91992 /ORGANISM="Bolidomonas pacifica, Strain CCMP 1866" /LENGTH=263 /DNA_ID=CAMNT_0006547657 /DNA_START=52 /DNA_END=840 /DNA_ORIENTATION=-
MAEAKEEGGELIVGHGPGLVHRFVNFAFQTINNEMGEFFNENCSKFEQDFDNYQKQGETLEQYACYQEYRGKLEEQLQKFVEKEEFDDEEECMMEIQRLVKEDLEKHKEQMKLMMKALKKAQKRAMKAIRRAQRAANGELDDVEDDVDEEKEEDSDEDSDSESKEGEQRTAPMLMFFSPTTLEQLVEMVMNLGEYQTFSMMMRMKVQQNRVMKLLMEARDGALGESKAIEGERIGEAGAKPAAADSTEVKMEEVKVEVDDDFF